jgi:predicted nucleotidyltransferase
MESLEEAKKFLESRKTNGTVLFVMVTGSEAYNLAEDHSDLDYLGVYLAPTTEILQIDADSHSTLSNRPGDPKPDITLHEAKNFCQLLLKGTYF